MELRLVVSPSILPPPAFLILQLFCLNHRFRCCRSDLDRQAYLQNQIHHMKSQIWASFEIMTCLASAYLEFPY